MLPFAALVGDPFGMLLCPRCTKDLVAEHGPHGNVFACVTCGGIAATMPVLRKRLEPAAINAAWSRARRAARRSDLGCPQCHDGMAEIGVQRGAREVVVEACDRCQIFIVYPGSPVPGVGASGGISGILAYYALAFPQVRIGFLVGGLGRVGWQQFWQVRIPVRWVFGLWFAWELMDAFSNRSTTAHHAHVGGALAGLAWWLVERSRRRRASA